MEKQYTISTGTSRQATVWRPEVLTWEGFLSRIRDPVRGTETQEEYLRFPKSRQDDLKDVGGFVGGTFSGLQRKAIDVTGRDLVTLDLDNMAAGDQDAVIARVRQLGCTAAVYSTRKHSPQRPRLRVIFPAGRTMTADEYEPVARKVASLIGMGYCDPTTFETNRLMFWPSCSRDGVFVSESFDGALLSPDTVLGMYDDWRDVSSWPVVPGTEAAEKRRLLRQTDPTTKEGLVGAFCRTYPVTEAMEKFIPGMYEPTDKEDRYTYTGGSTTGGVIVYDGDKFMFSHHATDPCSGKLCNAFDMIRLHKFSDLDKEVKPGTPANRLPSFKAMEQEALKDDTVRTLIQRERKDKAREAFASDTPKREQAEDDSWMEKLKVDGNGNYLKTINNLVVILQYDPQLKGRIVTDEFAGCGLVLDCLPWNSSSERRRWSDTDDAGALWYMETFYGISSKDKLTAALAIVGGQNTINEVRDYLRGLDWDGRKRIDTLLIDYLGAEDTPYTRAVMRKSLCAAAARAVEGGVKYDYMPIFTGPQGLGKSTFLATLGRDWFSDSLTTFDGKEAAEMIQGTWINEIGELTAMTRYETAAVKQFLSKRKDIYRAAYGRRTEEHPRRCVFFGTSNDMEFLKDKTGNRRFWPVDVGVNEPVKSVWEDLPDEVDQIWAEAYCYYIAGEKLYMTGQLEKMASEAQAEHSESSSREGMIREFLERKVPENWNQMSKDVRRMYLQGNMAGAEKVKLVPIDRICAAEIWEEVFGGNLLHMRRSDSTEINQIVANIPGWRRAKSTARYGPYGTQKGFLRV